MRLIDADALMMPINASWRDAGLHSEDYGKIKRWIKNAPTIEAEPVKHGRWSHHYDDELVSGTCTVCGWQSMIMETDVTDMPYCPNCGAKMDAEEGEGHEQN